MIENVEKKVKEIISEELGVGKEEIISTTNLKNDLGADSLNRVTITIALEEEFGIEIPDEDMEKIPTVGEVIEYIKKRYPASS